MMKRLGLALLWLLLAAAPTQAATLTLTPSSGPTGTSVRATGTGFGSRVWGTITFGTTKVNTWRSNRDGTIGEGFVVPSGYSGATAVVAKTDSGSASATATFTVGSEPPPPPPPPPSGVTWSNGWGSWDAFHWPDASWRPYADSSPVNTTYGESTVYRSDDAAMVARALNNHIVNPTWAPVGSNDWMHPYYFAHAGDPLYTIHCTQYACATMEGQQVRIPSQARPAGGGDAHMTILDQASGHEWDFWKSSIPSGSGGTLNVAGGGRMLVSGDGTASAGNGANASNTGLLWGVVRPEELAAGVIPHALYLVVYCTNGYVYPATGSARSCSSVSQSNTDAPPDGQLFKIAYTDAEIAALPIPAWKKAIVTALAHYGGYIEDTGGAGGVGIQFQSQQTYASYGDSTDGWNQFLGQTDVVGSTNNVEFELNAGVDWSRLHAVDPCVAARVCSGGGL